MAAPLQSRRLNPSLSYIFREAHEAKDARKPVDWSETSGRSGSLRATQRSSINEQALRLNVAQDIETLLNCVAFDSSGDLDEFSRVKSSVLNYGFPSLGKRTIDELERSGLEPEIERVLRAFEPRLIPSTLRVARDRRVDAIELKIRYIVHADLACEPVAIPLEFIADVEVTTGKIQIKRR
jgi:type VI secretion system protein ImpF